STQCDKAREGRIACAPGHPGCAVAPQFVASISLSAAIRRSNRSFEPSMKDIGQRERRSEGSHRPFRTNYTAVDIPQRSLATMERRGMGPSAERLSTAVANPGTVSPDTGIVRFSYAGWWSKQERDGFGERQ